MGRKGIGKLAPFGICRKIEVRSAGGPKGENGYRVSHFTMRYGDMPKGADADYEPVPGSEDRRWSRTPGTRITMSDFLARKVPDGDAFARQIGRKFSLGMPDFRISAHDAASGRKFGIAGTEVDVADGTKIALDERIDAGGQKLRVAGWVAYSEHPYENEEVAGVRIYARGRLAAATRDFGRGAGFAGEHGIRSRLVGEMHADWLDAEEDLIASGRRDVLWSSDRGEAFREWGREVVGRLGRSAEKAVRDAAYRAFADKSDFERAAGERFRDEKVAEAAVSAGKAVGRIADRDALDNPEHAAGLQELILAAAPSRMLVEKLALVASEAGPRAVGNMSRLFADARIAEIAQMGQVADARLGALGRLADAAGENHGSAEIEVWRMLEEAPWMINPRWTVLESSRTLENFRDVFQSWYRKKHGVEIVTTAANGAGKRPDFVLMSASNTIEVVEIKKPKHVLGNEDVETLIGYVDAIDEFMPHHREADNIAKCHVTLICDGRNFAGAKKRAYNNLVSEKVHTYLPPLPPRLGRPGGPARRASLGWPKGRFV